MQKNYYFQADRAKELGKAIGIEFPDEASVWIESADRFINGQVTAPSSFAVDWTFIGRQPNWDFFHDDENDRQVLRSLSRMHYLNDLARAWAVSGENRFADAWCSAVRTWINTVEFDRGFENDPLGHHPWNIEECAFRLCDSWTFGFCMFDSHPSLDAEISGIITASVESQASFIRKHAGILWPGANDYRYLLSMSALLHAGLFFLDDRELVSYALQELDRCMQVQFFADGGHISQCPAYHNGILERCLLNLRLVKENNLAPCQQWEDTCARASDFSASIARPWGAVSPAGDSDSIDRLKDFYLAGVDVTVSRSDVVLFGATRILQRPDLQPHGTATGRWAFFLGALPEGMMEAADIPSQKPLAGLFPDTGYASMRTDWTADADFVLARLGKIDSSHCHADLLSFTMCSGGQPLIEDPGRYEYNDTALRKIMRSSSVHSTASPEGVDQAVPDGPFLWRTHPGVELITWESGIDRVWLVAEFKTADYAHRRGFFFLTGSATGSGTVLGIFDEILRFDSCVDRDVVFRFPLSRRSVLIDEHGALTTGDGSNLAIFPVTGALEPVTADIWISPQYGMKYESKAVHFIADGQKPGPVRAVFACKVVAPGSIGRPVLKADIAAMISQQAGIFFDR